MSDIEKDTPVGVTQESAARSEVDRELAERRVAEANDKGLDLVGPDGVLTGSDEAGAVHSHRRRRERAQTAPMESPTIRLLALWKFRGPSR